MGLRKKTLLIVALTFLVLVALLFATARFVLLGGFADLERSHVRQNVRRALSALENEVSSLSGTTADWASWDDAYAFIQGRNQQFIDKNLVTSTFVMLRLHFIIFVDTSRRVVYQKGFDLEGKKPAAIQDRLLGFLLSQDRLARHPDPKSLARGMLAAPDGSILIVSSHPVLTSEEKGPVRGALIMGRVLSKTETARLSGQTHLSLELRRVDEAGLPRAFRDAALHRTEEGQEVWIEPVSEESVAGYAAIKDIAGTPSLILRAEMPRSIYRQGRVTFMTFIIFILVAGLFFGGATLLFLERTLLFRLARLSGEVSRIGGKRDLAVRVTAGGRDEISRLAGEINGLLDRNGALFQEAKAANRAKDEFLSNLNHELRSPLNSVIGLSDALLISSRDGETLSLVPKIKEAGAHLLRLIEDLLDFERIEIGKIRLEMVEIPPNDFLRTLAEERGSQLPEGFTIECSLDPSCGRIICDPTRVRQVFSNLLDNAVKYSPKGGTLRLRTESHPAEVWISVQDEGIGMSPEEVQVIFDRFRQLESGFRRRSGGLGIGLNLVHKLLELHGGRIWVESEKGRGSTFTFALPLDSPGEISLRNSGGPKE